MAERTLIVQNDPKYTRFFHGTDALSSTVSHTKPNPPASDRPLKNTAIIQARS